MNELIFYLEFTLPCYSFKIYRDINFNIFDKIIYFCHCWTVIILLNVQYFYHLFKRDTLHYACYDASRRGWPLGAVRIGEKTNRGEAQVNVAFVRSVPE